MTLQLCRCSLEEGDLEKGVLGWEQTCYSTDCRVACWPFPKACMHLVFVITLQPVALRSFGDVVTFEGDGGSLLPF